MALSATYSQPEHLRGLVDMGSNGIRFSISSLQPPRQRIVPTLYQHRAAISLYDAQYNEKGERTPIDECTVQAVIVSFKQFKLTCADFGVPEGNITVLATEATRTALNSEAFMARIKDHTGWEVKLLPKEDEGRVGAWGVASSLPQIKGLVMDLGGGSTQLSWIVKRSDASDVGMPESGAVSLPYGAAAMMRRLTTAERDGKRDELEQEVTQNLRDAYNSLAVPPELEQAAKANGGFTLFLSGGGFRGWGYILMSRHKVQPYPIPGINGFKVDREHFLSTSLVQAAAAAAIEEGSEDEIFRVSDRRAHQVPAVSFLVSCISNALPSLKEVRFCQGGVREGYLFSQLPATIRAEHPLVVASRPFSPSKAPEQIVRLLLTALPEGISHKSLAELAPITDDPGILLAFANLLYHHSSHSKDLQAGSALRSTTTGVLASVHGLLHESRTVLGLLLCARWGGAVPPIDDTFKRKLEQLVASPWTLWWINYIGAIAGVITAVFPAGVQSDEQSRLRFSCSWSRTDKNKPLVLLKVAVGGGVDLASLASDVKAAEKVGKRKKWIGGREGAGHRVEIVMDAVTIA